MRRRATTAFGLLGGVVVLLLSTFLMAHEKGSEKLPEPQVRMRVIAPSAKGPWLLRVDNEADVPMRIAADVRLLTLEVRVPSNKPIRQRYRHGWAKRAAVCDGPSDFFLTDSFPAARELVLEPGNSYTEEFDPRLICFGKNAELLVPGAIVKPYFGWKPKARWSRKMEAAPFVADSAHRPRAFRPMRRLEGASMVLSYAPPVVYGSDTLGRSGAEPKNGDAADQDDAESQTDAPKDGDAASGDDAAKGQAGGGGKPKTAEQASRHRPRPRRQRKRMPKDELGARMTLTSSHYADAVRPVEVSLSVEAHNTGERPVFVALRSRQLAFRVEGPNGVVGCKRSPGTHQVPRDLFQTLHHGKHVHMHVMLAEVCPPGTFDRPGLYVATPTLHADANGAQYGLQALTGKVTTRDPGEPGGTHEAGDDATLIRIRKGRQPFYRKPPSQLPTRVLPK